jgi:hypothetical protein
MSSITILFEGLCCHIEPPTGTIAVGRRTILPTAHDHITYIEVYPTDLNAQNSGFSFVPYSRDNINYRRAEVSNVKIELLNITSTVFTVLPSYTQRIPQLSKVEPSFTAVKASLLSATIPSSEVAAYFDITAGVLSSGPSESFRTEFDPEKNWTARHLGQWAQLDVEISGNAPTLRVTDLSSGATRDLVLKPGADLITIGNQMEDDILGIPPVTGMGGHFDMFYDLAAVPLTDRPTPKIGMGLGTGCSDSNFP